MTRRRLLTIVLIIAIFAALLLVACDGNAYRVNFYDGDALVFSFAVKKGGSLEEIPDVPYKEGKVGAWSVTDFDAVNSDITVYAVYSEAQYVVRFFVDDELYAERKVKRRSTLADVPAVPERAGFRGTWNVTDFAEVNRDLNVYAIYTAVEASVSFSVNGKITNTVYLSEGEDLTEIPAVPAYPEKNYSAKWVSGSADSEVDAVFTKISGDVTVYAHYYLTVRTANGDEDEFTCNIGDVTDAPVVGRKVGYDFVGWYKDADYTEKLVFPTTFEENCSIYARWLSSAGDPADFTFVDGVVTGYVGSGEETAVPYKYLDGDEEVVVTGIGARAFYGTTLRKITLPSTVKTIDSEAFRGGSLLTEVTFADGSFIETIGADAFNGCGRLESFAFSRFTSSIGDRAFNNCALAENYYNLGDTCITTLGVLTFSGNRSVENFTLPATLTTIAGYVFRNCNSASFTFRNEGGIESVGAGAFDNCVRLSGLTSPVLTSIGDGAFAGCYSLTSVSMVSDKPLCLQFGTVACENSYPVEYEATTYYLPYSLSSVLVTPNVRTGQNAAGTVVTDALYDCIAVKNVTLCEGIKLIKERAFRLNATATSGEFGISLPTTLTEIGKHAFEGRKDLKKIDLPVNLVTIDDYAFYQLDALATVNVPVNNALSKVGKYTFTDTRWYNEFDGIVYIGRVALGISEDYIAAIGKSNFEGNDFAGLDSVADYAFANNGRISSVSLPDNIIDVGEGAFAFDTALKRISFGADCTVGEGVVTGCAQLESVTVGLTKTVEGLFGTEAVGGMTAYVKEAETYYISPALCDLTLIADSKNEVDAGVYVNFATLQTITVSEGIVSVKDGAFVNNVVLTTVSLPASLTSIGYYDNYDVELASSAFDDVLKAKTISDYEDLLTNDADAVGVFGGCAALSVVTVKPNSRLNTIYPKVFARTALTSFTVPASVVSIGAFAFAFTPLTELTFVGGEADLDIGYGAFTQDDSGDSFHSYTLNLPTNLKRIAPRAFAFRLGITSVNFNEGLAFLGVGAFSEGGIIKLTLPAGVALHSEYCTTDAVLDPETGDVITPAETGTYGVFFAGYSPIMELTLSSPIKAMDIFGTTADLRLATVTINGGVIAEKQFMDFDTITSVVLNGVTSIGKDAFRNCSGLVGVTIPYTVTEIGDGAFAGAAGLRAFVFENVSGRPSRLTSIGKDLFEGDVALLTALFPSSVTNTVFDGVFNGCLNLTETNIPESVITLGDYAFNGCAALTSITIPENVTAIGDHAFDGCVKMEFENIKFDRLTSVGDYAFADCKLLHGVKAENISAIGDGAFSGCDNLKEITVKDKKVSDYIAASALPKIVTVNVSSAADGIISGTFDGCVNLASVMIYIETGLDDMLADIGELYGGKVFVTIEGYNAISEGVKTDMFGKLFTYPTAIDATYIYDEENKTATLSEITGFTGDVLFLPSTVSKDDVDYTVTAIGDLALNGNGYVQELIVPYTVETIGNSAFKNCAALTAVRFEIGSKLRVIGTNAFCECVSLTAISLPDGLQRIESRAFLGDAALAKVESTVYSKLAYIGQNAFYGAEALTSIVFNNNGNAFVIDNNAFRCSGLVNVDFANKNKSVNIGEYGFADCYDLDQNVIDAIVDNEHFVVADTAFNR